MDNDCLLVDPDVDDERVIPNRDSASCPFCLNHSPDDDDAWMSEGKSVTVLVRAHQRGCFVCSLIYRGIEALKPRLLTTDAWIQIVIEKDHIRLHWPQEEFAYQKATHGSPDSHWDLYFYADPDPDYPPPWSTFKKAPVYSRRFDDAETFSMLRKWLENCCLAHTQPMCRGAADRALPARVIDLGFGQQPRPKLIEPDSGTLAKYVALSHCWGQHRDFITEKQSLSQRKAKLEFDEMPKTFQDAIIVTWSLGIRYIWIDSLCIIQDDEDDWRKESVKMCDVYSDAFVTLSASSSTGDDVGFLKARPENFCGKLLCIDATTSDAPTYVFVQEELKHFRDLDQGVKLHRGDPLEDRAWALQEDLLSRRIISFGTGELSWECAERLTCECAEKVDSEGDLQKFGYEKLFSSEMTQQQAYDRWRAICVQYSKRRLTKASDKLPALSGLAQRFNALLRNDKYLAGLWGEDLLRGLLWAHDQSHRARPAYEMRSAWDQHIPTWSWASIDGNITYQHHSDSFCKPTESPEQWFTTAEQMHSLEVDSTGTLIGGLLRLRGPVVKVEIEWKNGLDGRCVSVQTPSQGRRELNIAAVLTDVPLELATQTDGANRGKVLTRSEHRRRMEWPASISVDCLILGASSTRVELHLVEGSQGGYFRKPREGTNHQVVHLIMLTRSTKMPEAYERLGLMVYVSNDNEHMDWIPDVEVHDLCLV